MHRSRSFQRVAGLLAVIAGPLALGGLALGLSAVNFNFDQFSDPNVILELGAAPAVVLRWSFLLSMVGSYLLLLPLAMWFGNTLAEPTNLPLRWYTFCGLGYLTLGALGAAILAAVWSQLITLYSSASGDQQTAIRTAFITATSIAEDGFQGVVQNIAGGIWWIGIGGMLWHQRRVFAGFTILLGLFSIANVVGTLVASEALSLVGLTATILLAPVWAIWAGLVVMRSSFLHTST